MKRARFSEEQIIGILKAAVGFGVRPRPSRRSSRRISHARALMYVVTAV